MYGKIFEQMYDGSLACGDWEALITMQQLIVLADQEGVVDMTVFAIHRRTTIPIDILEKGLKILGEPDPISRTKKMDGRRIVPIDPDRDWGWVLVNYKYYRDLANKADKREKDRIRAAEKRNEIKDVADSRNVSQCVADSRESSQIVPKIAHTDVDVDVIKHTSKSDDLNFSIFWELYPRKENKKKSETSWNRLTVTKKKAALAHLRKSPYHLTKKQFIPLPTTYINGERWDDAGNESKPYGHGAI